MTRFSFALIIEDEMYNQYWGLTEKPFENTSDPKMYYGSPKHDEAFSRLMYVVSEGKGAGMLTGDYGSGKTVLGRLLAAQLDPNQYRFIYIANPQMTGTEILREIVRAIGAVDHLPEHKGDVVSAVTDILRRNAEVGRTTTLIVDDAQLIREAETLEELRLLLNLQMNDRFLINLILIGQTELREKVNRIPQLKGRMAMRYHLNTLDEAETGEYLLHRLKVAGRLDPLFTDLAIQQIFEYAKGVPREINNVANLSLLIGFNQQTDTISREIVRAAVSELNQ